MLQFDSDLDILCIFIGILFYLVFYFSLYHFIIFAKIGIDIPIIACCLPNHVGSFQRVCGRLSKNTTGHQSHRAMQSR